MLVYGKYECFVMQMLYVCVLCASCGSSQCCMTCSLLMLVMEVFSVGGGGLLYRPCMVFKRLYVLCL